MIDIVNCMQAYNLELRKLVYLYFINYAKSQPDMAILAVNTFVKSYKSNSQGSSCWVHDLLLSANACLQISYYLVVFSNRILSCINGNMMIEIMERNFLLSYVVDFLMIWI